MIELAMHMVWRGMHFWGYPMNVLDPYDSFSEIEKPRGLRWFQLALLAKIIRLPSKFKRINVFMDFLFRFS